MESTTWLLYGAMKPSTTKKVLREANEEVKALIATAKEIKEVIQ